MQYNRPASDSIMPPVQAIWLLKAHCTIWLFKAAATCAAAPQTRGREATGCMLTDIAIVDGIDGAAELVAGQHGPHKGVCAGGAAKWRGKERN